MKVRVSEHQGVSPRTGKRVKGTLSTSVRDHMLNYDHTVAWENFQVESRESNHYLLETKESLFIKRDNPSLNRNKYWQTLFSFYSSQQDNSCIYSWIMIIVSLWCKIQLKDIPAVSFIEENGVNVSMKAASFESQSTLIKHGYVGNKDLSFYQFGYHLCYLMGRPRTAVTCGSSSL